MDSTQAVEITFGDFENKHGLWLKLNEPIPFKWKKVGDRYFLDLTDKEEKSWSLEEKREKHANAYKPWSPEEDDLLERLYADGMKTREISEQLGRNRGAITSRIKKLGLKEIY